MTASDNEDDNEEASVETTQIHPADVQEQVAQSACSTPVTSSLKQNQNKGPLKRKSET